jgi:NAD(P)H-nitrite reductase large subunit
MSSQSGIIDNLKVVCQCKGIKKGTFKRLMAEGGDTLEKLQRASGAGTGGCGGNRCTPRLVDLLAQKKG